MKLEQLNVNDIKPNPFQPREQFKEAELQELADNIKKYGLIEPIVVTKDLKIVVGERRWRAHKLAGIPKIYAIVKDYQNDGDIKRDSLVENELRENLNNEEFKSFCFSLGKTLGVPYFNKGYINGNALANYILGNTDSRSRARLANKIHALFEIEKKGTPKVKALVKNEQLNWDTAKRIVSVKDKDLQDELADLAKSKGSCEVEREVKKHNFEQESKAVYEKLKKENSEIKRTASEQMWLHKIESKIIKWKQEIAFANTTLEIANKKAFWDNFSDKSRMSALDSLKPLKREVDKMQHIVTKIMETISNAGGN